MFSETCPHPYGNLNQVTGYHRVSPKTDGSQATGTQTLKQTSTSSYTYLEVVVDGNRKCRPPKDVPTNMSWFGVPTSWISIGSLTLWQVSRVGITTVRQHLVDIPDPGHQQHRGQWFIIATRIDRITNTVASPAKLTYMYLPMSLYTSRSGSVELLLLAPWQKMWSDYCR